MGIHLTAEKGLNKNYKLDQQPIMAAGEVIRQIVGSIRPTPKVKKDAEPIIIANLKDMQGKLSPLGIQALIKLYPHLGQPSPAPARADTGVPAYIPPPGDAYTGTYYTAPENSEKDSIANYMQGLNLPQPKAISGASRVMAIQAKEAKAERFAKMEGDKHGNNE